VGLNWSLIPCFSAASHVSWPGQSRFIQTYEVRRILEADGCLVGVITRPKPGGSLLGRGGVNGARGLGLEPIRGDGFAWAI
jgi:hypothetical protein